MLIARLWRFQSAVFDAAAPHLEPIGLTPKALVVLQMVDLFDHPTEIARALNAPHSTISHHLREIEDAGWIARAIDPGDRRRFVVSLTEAGREIMDQGRRIMAGQVERRLATLSESERAGLEAGVGILDRLAGAALFEVDAEIA